MKGLNSRMSPVLRCGYNSDMFTRGAVRCGWVLRYRRAYPIMAYGAPATIIKDRTTMVAAMTPMAGGVPPFGVQLQLAPPGR